MLVSSIPLGWAFRRETHQTKPKTDPHIQTDLTPRKKKKVTKNKNKTRNKTKTNNEQKPQTTTNKSHKETMNRNPFNKAVPHHADIWRKQLGAPTERRADLRGPSGPRSSTSKRSSEEVRRSEGRWLWAARRFFSPFFIVVFPPEVVAFLRCVGRPWLTVFFAGVG